MSTYQSISVKSAEILTSKLLDIYSTGVLDNIFIGFSRLGSDLARDLSIDIQNQIADANLLNSIIGTNEIKINFNQNTQYSLTQLFEKYEEHSKTTDGLSK